MPQLQPQLKTEVRGSRPLDPRIVRALLEMAFDLRLSARVEFRKRSDGTLRTMNLCQVPASQLRGSASNGLDAAGAETFFVWDLDKHKPASVPQEGVLSFVFLPGGAG